MVSEVTESDEEDNEEAVSSENEGEEDLPEVPQEEIAKIETYPVGEGLFEEVEQKLDTGIEEDSEESEDS